MTRSLSLRPLASLSRTSFTFQYYRAYEYWNVKEVLKSEANGRKDKDRVIEGVKNSSSIVLAKSFKKIEGKYSDYFTELTGKRVVPEIANGLESSNVNFIWVLRFPRGPQAMKFGVPIIVMPMHLYQPVNARLVVELGLGKEVLRDGNGVLSRHKVAEVVE
nr:hypothetical protein [Tanacetum cinerariifolium]